MEVESITVERIAVVLTVTVESVEIKPDIAATEVQIEPRSAKSEGRLFLFFAVPKNAMYSTSSLVSRAVVLVGLY